MGNCWPSRSYAIEQMETISERGSTSSLNKGCYCCGYSPRRRWLRNQSIHKPTINPYQPPINPNQDPRYPIPIQTHQFDGHGNKFPFQQGDLIPAIDLNQPHFLVQDPSYPIPIKPRYSFPQGGPIPMPVIPASVF